MEHDALGLYISGHPLDDFPYDGGAIHIGEVAGWPLGSEFRTVGIVVEAKNHVDRKSELMAFVTLEDIMSRLEVIIFASVYRGDLKIGVPVHLHGRLEQYEPLKAIAIDYEVVNLQGAALAA